MVLKIKLTFVIVALDAALVNLEMPKSARYGVPRASSNTFRDVMSRCTHRLACKYATPCAMRDAVAFTDRGVVKSTPSALSTLFARLLLSLKFPKSFFIF